MGAKTSVYIFVDYIYVSDFIVPSQESPYCFTMGIIIYSILIIIIIRLNRGATLLVIKKKASFIVQQQHYSSSEVHVR